jgi:hypothetical protein
MEDEPEEFQSDHGRAKDSIKEYTWASNQAIVWSETIRVLDASYRKETRKLAGLLRIQLKNDPGRQT